MKQLMGGNNYGEPVNLLSPYDVENDWRISRLKPFGSDTQKFLGCPGCGGKFRSGGFGSHMTGCPCLQRGSNLGSLGKRPCAFEVFENKNQKRVKAMVLPLRLACKKKGYGIQKQTKEKKKQEKAIRKSMHVKEVVARDIKCPRCKRMFTKFGIKNHIIVCIKTDGGKVKTPRDTPCRHCAKNFTKAGVRKHERSCFRNPKRRN